MTHLGRLLVIFILSGCVNSVWAQGARRLGVIDINAETISPAQRINVINEIKKNLTGQRILSLVRDEEIENFLVLKNELRSQVERQKREHENNRADIESQIERGKKYYLASEFEEAIALLKSTFLELPNASLSIKSEMVSQILETLAVSEYFLGRDDAAKSYIEMALDFDPATAIDAERYPVQYVDLFSSVKEKKRRPWKQWSFNSNITEFNATFLGRPLMVESGRIFSIKLPIDNANWRKQSLVLRAKGYAPLILPLESLPDEISFRSLSDRRRSTKGLFGPIGALTPPVELKRFIVKLKLDVIFLGSAARDRSGRWNLRGQWLEGSTSRTSPVIGVADSSLVRGVNRMVSALLSYLTPEGHVLVERAVAKTRRPASMPVEKEEVKESKPYYKTWWFWTAVGAGVVGVGAGSYFLFKPDDALKFSVQKQ